MAKSINPHAKKTQPIVPPTDVAKQKELLARATGAAKPIASAPAKPAVQGSLLSAMQQAPAPAKLPPGVTGTPPLPAGKIVGRVGSMTDLERETLESVGWTTDVPLPTTAEGLKELQEAIERHSQIEVPLNLPTKPFVPPEPTEISHLPPAQQAGIIDAMKAINAAEEQRVAAERERKKIEAAGARVKGYDQAVGAMNKAVENFQKKIETEHTYNAEEVTSPEAEAPEPQAPQPKAPEARKAPSPPVSETGADARLTHCPHCLWDLSIDDIPEPPHGDKMAFLQCLLGMKDYTKVYPLFNGTFYIKFRTLSKKELDIVYRQTYADRITAKFETGLDYYERLNQYRTMLQLCDFRSAAGEVIHDLPDGYSRSTNKHATGVWVSDEREAELPHDETDLPAIEQYLTENVLAGETLFKVVSNACHQFNRLVAKMEAMADNSDFWKPTEGQSS